MPDFAFSPLPPRPQAIQSVPDYAVVRLADGRAAVKLPCRARGLAHLAFAAGTTQQITGAQAVECMCGDMSDGCIAGMMTMSIVDEFEVIDIKHQYRCR